MRILAENGPDDLGPDSFPNMVWFENLYLTDLGEKLVSKYDLTNKLFGEEICEPFISEVESLFEASGVPLSAGILIPIKK